MLASLPRQDELRVVARWSQFAAAFPVIQAGRLLHYPFRGLLNVYSRSGLRTRQVAQGDPLYIEVLSMVNSVSIAPIATGWSDQLPGGIRTH